MQQDDTIIKVLERYVELDDALARRLSDELASATENAIVGESRERILQKIELHSAAHDAIEQEVSRFREQLYEASKTIAKQEMETGIITSSHVTRARYKIWKGYRKLSFTDGFLAIGSLLVGAAFPHLLSISSGTSGNVWLLGLGILGGALLGMGIFAKARGE